jgi:hypothetical protein
MVRDARCDVVAGNVSRFGFEPVLRCMTRTPAWLLALSLLIPACDVGVEVLSENADGGPTLCDPMFCEPRPPLELCTGPVRNPVGPFSPPTISTAILIAPSATLAGPVTVRSAARAEDGVTTIVVDDAGTERTITVPLTTWAPPLSSGDVLVARSVAPDSGPEGTARSLVFRDDTGELRAGWIRSVRGWSERIDISGILHTSTSATLECYQPTGGPCGRGLHQYILGGYGGSARVGEPGVMLTPEGPIEVTVSSLSDDGWFPPGGACAIGLLGSVELDFRAAP